jgi:tetratricopeptide (TPR) repeat protein
MLDWELFGENAGGHHWTNLIFHICNTILLFLLLNRMTGAVWRSGLVAALFAVHPINVESVAWVAERKNVLSTFFWFLTMLFYVWYVRKPGWKRYLPVFVCFALGLMSKPMLVTLPFVLLLMDYWPLNRTVIESGNDRGVSEQAPFNAAKAGWVRLILEKIPLFSLMAVSVVLTIYAATSNSTIVHLNMLPFSQRVENAILSYALYLKKLIWPADLAVFYPLLDIPLHHTLTAGILLIVITVVSCKYYKRHPYLAVGWLWYLGTLVPVIGIVQVGSQSMADRYAYVSFVGLFVSVVWLIADVVRGRFLQKIAIVFLVALLLCLSYAAHRQAGYWQNTFMLFQRAFDVTKEESASSNVMVVLGNELIKQGKTDEAITYFHRALRGRVESPADYDALVSLANALSLQGKKLEAISAFQRALRVNPAGHEAYYRLGAVYFERGRVDEATDAYRKAVSLKKGHPMYHGALGNAYFAGGKTNEAIKEYEEVLRIQAFNIDALNNLGVVLMAQGKMDDAAGYFLKSLTLEPKQANIHFYLYKIFERLGENTIAQDHYRKAVHLDPQFRHTPKESLRESQAKIK